MTDKKPIDTGGYITAFPKKSEKETNEHASSNIESAHLVSITTPITWLDLCAMMAMGNLISSPHLNLPEKNKAHMTAILAYEFAQAMLQRKRKIENGKNE